jgi:hypothetical protein
MIDLLKTFISSPNDVAKEREIAMEVINRINDSCRDTLGIELDAVSWKKKVPQAPNIPEETIQTQLNQEIQNCHIFILCLYKRYGSCEAGQVISNTEREVNAALEKLKKYKKLMFLTYFRNLPTNRDAGPQEQKVIDFRKRLEKEGIWYRTYSDPEDFKMQLTHDLYQTILKFRLSTSKQRALHQFWSLGIPDRFEDARLAIIYPAVDRHYMAGLDEQIWFSRLAPNMIFEDFKAIQKLDKTLRLVGFHDYKICTMDSAPPSIEFMNRFWICLPRNYRALTQLKLYERELRFSIKKKNEKIIFQWRTANSKKYVLVNSPLAHYLRLQRAEMNVKGDWHPEMGKIIAKDYAIISRFRNNRSNTPMRKGTLKDFFLGGIRGLGTWGAGWFIDRHYDRFVSFDDDADFQLLLEVVYRNGRIYEVNDVSDKPQSYFNKQNNPSKIEMEIDQFKREEGFQ